MSVQSLRRNIEQVSVLHHFVVSARITLANSWTLTGSKSERWQSANASVGWWWCTYCCTSYIFNLCQKKVALTWAPGRSLLAFSLYFVHPSPSSLSATSCENFYWIRSCLTSSLNVFRPFYDYLDRESYIHVALLATTLIHMLDFPYNLSSDLTLLIMPWIAKWLTTFYLWHWGQSYYMYSFFTLLLTEHCSNYV